MGKLDLDGLLDELGGDGADKSGGGGAPKRVRDTGPARPHRIDKAEESFSSLPAAPSGQGTDARDTVADDPAAPVKPPSERQSAVGSVFASVYTPEGDEGESGGLGAMATLSLDDLLLQREAVTPREMEAARNVLKQSPGASLVDVLLEQGCDEAGVQKVVAEHSGLPFVRVDLEKGLEGGFDGGLTQRLGFEFCRDQFMLPLGKEGARVVVGVIRPADVVFQVDGVRRRLNAPGVKLVVITPGDLKAALEMVGVGDAADADLGDILSDISEEDVEVQKAAESTDEVDLEQMAGDAPVIRYVNYIIQTAVKEGASDIHVEAGEKSMKVRLRVDGILMDSLKPPASMAAAITSRLKIMANLDISERRVPQDGRIRCTVQGRKLDLRVSTLPSAYGEKVVMRILDTRSINVQLEDLGFDPDTLEIWRRQIAEPHGIVLVTGPTGSGKTTTLYSSLRQIDKNTMNVSTVEDPIEYHLDGITQTQTHEKIGMTFAKALKALLRQDPDVILLGEIRDHETAHTAVQAALTGHLVLSTLHTNDAPSSVTRLVNIGLEPFLVGAAVNAVLAQRLVRKLCDHCKTQQPESDEMAEFLQMQGIDPNSVWTGPGCDRCRQRGYSGRLGLYELLCVDDQMRDVIARNPNVSEFRRMCIERGMVTLRDDGMRKVATGKTTVQEVFRVTESGH